MLAFKIQNNKINDLNEWLGISCPGEFEPKKKIISCLHNQAVLISPMQDDFDYSVGDGTQLLFRLCQTLLFSYNFFGQKLR